MSDIPRFVHLVEEGPREGFQIEPGPIAVQDKLRLIDALARTGLRKIQAASFVDAKRVPGMAEADVLARGLKPYPGVAYDALWYNKDGLQRALASGNLTLSARIGLYASGAFLMKNLGRTQEQHLSRSRHLVHTAMEMGVPVRNGSIAAAFGCNFEGDISTAQVIDTARQVFSLAQETGVVLERLVLADTMAWANPAQVTRVIGALREQWPDMPLGLHLHDTRGLAMANAHAALMMGVDQFDASVGGLGGCPFANHRGAAGNICTEDLVFMLHEMGVETGVDLERLIECALIAQEVVGHPLAGSVMKGGSLDRLRKKN